MVKYKDYYASLGLSRSATDKEIKTAYRKLARQHHPDANLNDKAAEERFKEITEAYEVLKDPEKRRRYDMLGANWKAGADFTPPPDFSGFNFDFGNLGGFGKNSPFSDFFDALFGQTFGQTGQTANQRAQAQGVFGQGARKQTAPQNHQEAEIELSIEELAKGANRNIQLTRPGQATKNLQVKIPAGVRPGARIRIPGEGGSINLQTGTASDLYLRVKLKAHPIYSIEGENLISELRISPARAILGGETKVETLDGMVQINIPAYSQQGKVLRLRERGLPKLKQNNRGDHLVKLKIVIPTSLTNEEKECWEELLKLENSKNKK